MKKNLFLAMSLTIALIFSGIAQAQTPYDAAIDAENHAYLEYVAACEQYDNVTELATAIGLAIGDLTEEDLGSELWADLQDAWEAILNVDSTYNEGLGWVDDALARWQSYSEAGSDEERIFILLGIEDSYDMASDCFADAADGYAALIAQLTTLLAATQNAALPVELAAMNSKQMAMTT